ncbi:hypothetical protein FPK06_17060 [Mycobacterium tuberculosis]|nr:hypothetical protein FPK06_17060 [Mycobacterium tuberculosis]
MRQLVPRPVYNWAGRLYGSRLTADRRLIDAVPAASRCALTARLCPNILWVKRYAADGRPLVRQLSATVSYFWDFAVKSWAMVVDLDEPPVR